MPSIYGIISERQKDGFTVISIDTSKAKFQGMRWRTLGDWGKRKFENVLFLTRAKEKLKIIYI